MVLQSSAGISLHSCMTWIQGLLVLPRSTVFYLSMAEWVNLCPKSSSLIHLSFITMLHRFSERWIVNESLLPSRELRSRLKSHKSRITSIELRVLTWNPKSLFKMDIRALTTAIWEYSSFGTPWEWGAKNRTFLDSRSFQVEAFQSNKRVIENCGRIQLFHY